MDSEGPVFVESIGGNKVNANGGDFNGGLIVVAMANDVELDVNVNEVEIAQDIKAMFMADIFMIIDL